MRISKRSTVAVSVNPQGWEVLTWHRIINGKIFWFTLWMNDEKRRAVAEGENRRHNISWTV